jgi:predicted HicB family RNase H-like nuclease
MNYKGYIGKVEYDEENHIFSGEVVNTKTVITFQGTSVREIEDEFRASVDDYLAWCKEEGIEPEKPYSGKFNVRFQPEVHQRAAVAAKLSGISLNAFITNAVLRELNNVAKV